MASPDPPPPALIQWRPSNPSPCFCRPTLGLDVAKLAPGGVLSAFTLSAAFAVPVDALSLENSKGESVAFPDGAGFLVAAGETYSVVVETPQVGIVPIKQLYGAVVAGFGEDAVRRLSTSFYRRVFAGEDEFSALFKAVTTEARAADNQCMWFTEMWGGPKLYTEKYGSGALLHRMFGKHPEAIMTPGNALAWLSHMKAALLEVLPLPDDATPEKRLAVASAAAYFKHFLAFFPFPHDARGTMVASL